MYDLWVQHLAASSDHCFLGIAVVDVEVTAADIELLKQHISIGRTCAGVGGQWIVVAGNDVAAVPNSLLDRYLVLEALWVVDARTLREGVGVDG